MKHVTFGMLFEEGSRCGKFYASVPHGSLDTQFNSMCDGSIY